MHRDFLIQLSLMGLSAFLLQLNLRRALLFLMPSHIQVESEDPSDQMKLPEELQALARALESLGFRPLGSRSEKAPLASRTTAFDYVLENVFATLWLGRGNEPLLYYLTPTKNGFVLTANHRRAARDVPGRYLCAGLEDVSADRLYKAHLRRVAPFTPEGTFDVAGRLEAATRWLEGPGRAEIRQQNLPGLLWTLGSFVIVAAALLGKW